MERAPQDAQPLVAIAVLDHPPGQVAEHDRFEDRVAFPVGGLESLGVVRLRGITVVADVVEERSPVELRPSVRGRVGGGGTVPGLGGLVVLRQRVQLEDQAGVGEPGGEQAGSRRFRIEGRDRAAAASMPSSLNRNRSYRISALSSSASVLRSPASSAAAWSQSPSMCRRRAVSRTV